MHRPLSYLVLRPGFFRVLLLAGLFTGLGGCEFLSSLTGGDDMEGDGGVVALLPCAALCEWEEECGIRSLSECKRARCGDGADAGLFDNAEFDACLEDVRDCQSAVLCSCPSACTKVEECVGSPDPECEDSCEAIMAQLTEQTVAENVCILETECADVAVCGGVAQ